MAKTVVVLSWWFVLLFIVRDIPSRNVVLHMCFPTKSVSHCSVPPSHAICCAVSNVWPIWETRPWQCARSVRLWDMAMQKGKWLGSTHPGWQSPPAWHYIFSIGNPSLNLRFLWLACIVVEARLKPWSRKSWMSMRWAKRWLPSAPFVDEVFRISPTTGGFWRLAEKMPTGPRGFLRYGREVAVMPQNVAERVAKRGESQEFVLGGSSRLHRESCRLDGMPWMLRN